MQQSRRGLPHNTNTARVAHDALAAYMASARKVGPLTADEERRSLLQLVELRRRRWLALLSCSYMTLEILRWSDEVMRRPDLPPGHGRDLVRAIKADDHGQGDDLVRSMIEDLATSLARIDCGLVDRACEHVEGLATVPVRIGSGVRVRELGTPGFAAYLDRVRREGAAYAEARNRFVCSNLRLVVTIAARYSSNRMSLADRVQDGNLGLMKAVQRFDVDRGTRFSTYAVYWIRYCIFRALFNHGREIRIPVCLHQIFMRARVVEPQLQAVLCREVTVEEIAARLEVKPARLTAACEAMELRFVGLAQPSRPKSSPTVVEMLRAPATPDAADAAIDQQRHLVHVRRALASLDPRSRDIVRLRFGLDGDEPWTLCRLGERHGLSRERVRQIQKHALGRLRADLDDAPASASAPLFPVPGTAAPPGRSSVARAELGGA